MQQRVFEHADSSVACSLLEPSYGWGELPLTLDAAVDLFTSIPAFPQLSRQIKAFGRRETDFCRDEGFSAFEFSETLDRHGKLSHLGIVTKNYLPNCFIC